MRISDWSSDVCSSDLSCRAAFDQAQAHARPRTMRAVRVVAPPALGLGRLAAAFIEADRRLFLDHRALRERAHLVSALAGARPRRGQARSEGHTPELTSLMRPSHAVFGLKQKNKSEKNT